MAPATSLPSVALPEPPVGMSRPPDIDQPKASAPDKGICITQVNADDWDAFGNSPDDITFEVSPLVVEDNIESIRAAEQHAQLQEEAFVQAQREEKTRQEEQGRHQREASEKASREEQERLQHEAEAKAAREEQERLQHEAEAKAAQEEQERLQHEAEAKSAREEQERLQQQAAAKAAREEQERLQHEAEAKAAREEQERLQHKAEAKEEMAEDALYQAVKNRNVAEINVLLPITTSRLWQTSPISLAKLRAWPKPRSKPLVCRRSCKIAQMFPDGWPSKTGIAFATFRGESHLFSSSRSVPRSPFHARRCCTLLGGVGSGRCTDYARTLQNPFLVGHSGGS